MKPPFSVEENSSETIVRSSSTKETLLIGPEWPVIGLPTGCSEAASHTRTVLSDPPETICLPSRLNATESIDPEWPVIGSLLANGLTRRGVPHPQCLVVGSRHDAGAVGAERDGPGSTGVASHEIAQRFSGIRVPPA